MIRARTVLLAVLAMSVHAAEAADTDLVERGDATFQRLCAPCHGKGRGDDTEPATLLPGTLALRLKYRGERPALLEQRTDLSPATLRVYPDGEAKAADEYEAELMPTADFGKVGEAFGAYGAKITDPADVPAAIARCVKEVRDGRSAVLHVQVTKM